MWKLFIVPIFALVAGIWGLPNYGFYQFLRIAVALQAAGFALVFYNQERIWDKALTIYLFAIAIIFFPIFDIHFSRYDWQIIDIIAGLSFMAINFYIIKIDNQKNETKTEELQQEIRNLFLKNNKLKDENNKYKQSLELLNKKINQQTINKSKYEELEQEFKDLELQKTRLEQRLRFYVKYNKETNEFLTNKKISNILSADIEIINTHILNSFLTHKSIVVRYDVVQDIFLLELFKAEPILNGYDGYFDTSIPIFITTNPQMLLSKEHIENNIENYKKSLWHIVLRNLNKIIINILSEYVGSKSYSTNITILKHNF